MNMSHTEYIWSIKRLGNLLEVDSKLGSLEDLEIVDLARKVEDYEIAHAGERFNNEVFEPMVIVTDGEPYMVTR